MIRKTDKALRMFRAGDFRGAFSIFSTFRVGFTREETRTLQIASESLGGHAEFYQSLGVDTNAEVSKAKEIIRNKYQRAMNESAGSKGIERICSHRIEWWLDSGTDEPITELDEVSIEHIQQCLIEGYVEGELCVCRPDTDEDGEVYGWWKIAR